MKNYTYLILFSICLQLGSCDDNDDNNKGNEDRPETLAWIEDTMRKHYYWSDDIPKENLNYSIDPEAFFTNLLSKEDGKTLSDGTQVYYSYIENLADNTRGHIQPVTYGFEFLPVRFKHDNTIKAIILYVLPDSPASRAGLKRGDWITKIDSRDITTNEMMGWLYGDVGRTFTIAEYDIEMGVPVDKKTIDISSAVTVVNHPVYMSEVLTHGSKKIGYLVYNSFDDGKVDGSKTTPYDDELRRLSAGKFSGVDEFVLDLRYNNGGLLTCVQLLSTILCPQDKLGSQLGYLEYKDERKEYFSADSRFLNPGGKNLNLKRLYVLVSAWSASASEAIINLLNPFMEVIVIGRQTEGKNVGSQPYTNVEETWKMHPITCLIANSDGFSNYKNGFMPDYDKGDVFDYNPDNTVALVDDVYPLGNRNERLLKVALQHIATGTYNESGNRSVSEGWYKEEPASLRRKAINSVIINTVE